MVSMSVTRTLSVISRVSWRGDSREVSTTYTISPTVLNRAAETRMGGGVRKLRTT